MSEEVMDGTGAEVLAPTAGVVERMERASIDVQIATAHQYPRSMARFKRSAMEMVTLDEETAQSCIYRRPVGKKGNQVEYAEGKSIRMAEIVGACYGNLRVGSMLVEADNPKYVKARGFAHDLESNFAATSEVVESTLTKEGRPYSERMRLVVAKAALSKARRDATFQVVPCALCKALEAAARMTAIGTEATLGARRNKVLDWINKARIEAGRVWAALGVTGIEDVGLDEMETLTGLRTAIHDKDVSIDEAFPPLVKNGGGATADALKDKLAGGAAKRRGSDASAPEHAEPEPDEVAGPDRAELLDEVQALVESMPKGAVRRALKECNTSETEYADLSADSLADLLAVLRAG